MSYIESNILPNIALIINCSVIIKTFPPRYSVRFSIITLTLFTAGLYLFDILTGTLGTSYGGVRGILYLPLIIWLHKKLFFQRTFMLFLQLLVTMLLAYLAAAVIMIFTPRGSDAYYISLLISVVFLYSIYVVIMFKLGQLFLDRLFSSGSSGEWALYSLGSIFSFIMLAVSSNYIANPAFYILFLLFLIWSIGVLCYAIINTHEKSKQRYEAELARSIVSSGRGHYQKMNGLRDELRVMRHDYQYHLSAARQMLKSGNVAEADDYLSEVETRLSENDLRVYCENTVVGALVASYAERCGKSDFEFTASIDLPETITIPNYDLCIVLGNLLENAVEACGKCDGSRTIELKVKPHEKQLIIMVKNTFDGKLAHDAGQAISSKPDGGFGLKSVQAVAMRYDGELITEWDDTTYTAYAYMRL